MGGGIKYLDDNLLEYLEDQIKLGNTLIPIYPEQTLMVNFLSLDKLYVLERIFKVINE